MTYYLGVKILSFIILGILPIMLGVITNDDRIVYIFGVLLFLALGLVKMYLDKNPISLLSNQFISAIMVGVLYVLSAVLLLGISQLWVYINIIYIKKIFKIYLVFDMDKSKLLSKKINKKVFKINPNFEII